MLAASIWTCEMRTLALPVHTHETEMVLEVRFHTWIPIRSILWCFYRADLLINFWYNISDKIYIIIRSILQILSHLTLLFLGFITEQQFVNFVQGLPPATVSAILDFSIIPPDVNAEAHRAFTAMTKNSASLVRPCKVPATECNIGLFCQLCRFVNQQNKSINW